MKKTFKIGVFVIFAATVFLLINNLSLAAYTYTPMEKIPGTAENSGDFPQYIMAIYKFAIWTVGIAAMFMVTIGGFMYFGAAGNTSKLEKAKTVITDALLGVVMVLTAWLLLYTINPDMTSINLDSLKAMKIDK